MSKSDDEFREALRRMMEESLSGPLFRFPVEPEPHSYKDHRDSVGWKIWDVYYTNPWSTGWESQKPVHKRNYPASLPEEVKEALDVLDDEEVENLRLFKDKNGFVGVGLKSEHGWMIKPCDKLWVFDILDKQAKKEIDRGFGNYIQMENYGPKHS
jgi:hypothetical protein